MERRNYWILIQVVTSVLSITGSLASEFEKSAVFLSPKFELEPGSVLNKYFLDIEFPRGHIAVKSFDAEVVDESGNPVPLHETYLHHWIVEAYRAPPQKRHVKGSGLSFVQNSGVCQRNVLRQYFGLGSETRKTPTRLPGPYGTEAGKFGDERWMLNLHAIDTRGAEDKLGCTECRCDLYNVTVGLKRSYKGGLYCCEDQARCRLREGRHGGKRALFLRYTVTWVDWSNSVFPVKIYILDVTDTHDGVTTGALGHHKCHVEYDIAESCDASNSCVHTRRNTIKIPRGGHVIYAVAHQHTGGLGSTLFGEDGRVVCKSEPIYGKGKEAGDEEGYIVGMSVCYPELGSVEILDGESLLLEARYNSTREHTGVMSLFYVVVADHLPNPDPVAQATRYAKWF